MKYILCLMCSLLIGCLYRNTDYWHFLPLVFVFWALVENKRQAFVVMFIYYTSATFDLVNAIGVFFNDVSYPMVFGAVLWLSLSSLLSLVFSIAWVKKGKGWSVLLALLFVTVPPIGIVSLANPISSIGYLFAGCGALGILLLTATIFLLVSSVEKKDTRYLTGIVLVAISTYLFKDSSETKHFDVVTVNTSYKQVVNDDDNYQHYAQVTKAIIKVVRDYKLKNALIVFPETIGGEWNAGTKLVFSNLSKKLAQRDLTVLLGAEIAHEKQYYNSLVSIGSESMILNQRIPVPVSMYKPWSDNGSIANVFGSGEGRWLDKRFSYFVCWENLIVFPFMMSMQNKSDFIVSVSNLWFAKNTRVEYLQRNTLKSFALLQNKNYYYSINK